MKFPPDTLDTVTVQLFAARFYKVCPAGGEDAMMREIDVRESRERLNARNVYYPRLSPDAEWSVSGEHARARERNSKRKMPRDPGNETRK